ncbi:MAG: SpoVR family protein [Planctomycetota bacterium]
MPDPLYTGPDWDFATLERIHDAIEPIAIDELGLDIYPNQIEVITSEQMLDAYTSTGMPMMYSHWSFGKNFAREEWLYRKGAQSLAYELVINSNPCVSYVMEENTTTMQALVIAHAAFGHNHFFKNNHVFQAWTHADSVLDDLSYAKRFIAAAGVRHGELAVERTLDAAHALMNYGVSKYATTRCSKRERERRLRARQEFDERNYDDLLHRTNPNTGDGSDRETKPKQPVEPLPLPEENLLEFLAEFAPRLEDWQREVLRIVARLSQYFYPQRQTKLMNEGCATFVHYHIMHRMYDRGLIDEGSMLEFLRSHTAVVAQPRFDQRNFSGINPYALGFAMMRDIQRICQRPEAEDREWFPEIAGCGDGMAVLRDAWRDYRDESFVLQFLSPRLIREMHLFAVSDNRRHPFLAVAAIHDEEGYRDIRRQLARSYDLAQREPEIEVIQADLKGNRHLVLRHRVRRGRLLTEETCNRTLRYIAKLWGYRVKLLELDAETGRELRKHEAVPEVTA